MPRTDQFQTVFEQLRSILQPYAASLNVQADEPANYSLSTHYLPQLKRELFFGATQIKKNYVSYHFMPVYVCPALLEELSPALKKRMQGKACFNFTAVDQTLFDELKELTARGWEEYQQAYLGESEMVALS